MSYQQILDGVPDEVKQILKESSMLSSLLSSVFAVGKTEAQIEFMAVLKPLLEKWSQENEEARITKKEKE